MSGDPSQEDVDAALGRLFELAVVLFQFMERGLAEHGLTRARATVLWHLYHQGPMTQRQLSQVLGVTPRNVTGLLDGLQAADLVMRRRHPTDRRATLVTLTDQGRTAAAAMHVEYQHGAARLLGDVPAADLTSFVTTLDHVLGRLHDEHDAHRPANPARSSGSDHRGGDGGAVAGLVVGPDQERDGAAG
ncbi:MAG: MarR family winged helix-turn-helix transcriptional regulator [Streptomycetales bacterium]